LGSVFVLSLSSAWVCAADVTGSQDLAQLPRFARAQIVGYRQTDDLERVFPAAPLRRISGQLRMEAEVASVGLLTALTYQLPAQHSADEAFTAAREHLQAQGAQLLFWCQGRDCGAGSLWANNVFANAQLNGGDEQQAYALLRLAAPEQDSLLAMYGVSRGSRGAYLHVERLQASAPLGELLPNAATLLRELISAGQLLLVEEPAAQWVTLLANSLKMNSSLRVSLAGPQAVAWLAALNAQGVRANRLQVVDSANSGLLLKVLRD
jgi:hypothetical protein